MSAQLGRHGSIDFTTQRGQIIIHKNNVIVIVSWLHIQFSLSGVHYNRLTWAPFDRHSDDITNIRCTTFPIEAN